MTSDSRRSPRDSATQQAIARLETEIRSGIPLARALGVRVECIDAGGVQLTAPWAPNRNGHGSLFGGSAVALGLVAGWALVMEGLRDLGVSADVVIQDLHTRFDRPILDEVRVRAVRPAADAWERFLRAVDRRGRGRIGVRVEVDGGEGQTPTVLEGRFVALRKPDNIQ